MLNRQKVAELIHLFYNHVGKNKSTNEYHLAEDGFHHLLVDFFEPKSGNMTDKEYADALDSIQSEFCPDEMEVNDA